MTGLIEGKAVHYVNENGQHMAAIVVRVNNQDSGFVNLQVFEDLNGINYVGGVGYSADHSPGTWHWLETDAPVSTSALIAPDDQTS
ncbi:MAG: hypothetical protein P4L49_02670 [Desulfosporosinus sp.]|nr:hypothetical protein [Desulfosporosinus sp.]